MKNLLGAAMKLSLLCAVLVLGTGCGNVQKQLNTVLVFEQSAQGYVQQLTDAARAAAATMPADKRDEYTAKIDGISKNIVVAMSAKDDALQAAIAANSVAGIDFARLTQDVVTAIQALVALVEIIGNEQQKIEVRATAARLIDRQVKAKAALAQ